MIDYKDFLKEKINPSLGISDFIFGKKISEFYCYLDDSKKKKIKEELLNDKYSLYKISLWGGKVILFFNSKEKELETIVINDSSFSFEDYKIGMSFKEAANLETSIYNVDKDEDIIYHKKYKDIFFTIGLEEKEEIIKAIIVDNTLEPHDPSKMNDKSKN